jgi:antitoxin ParD1/3/4
MVTRNVVLTEHHEKVIERLVKSGRYQNASEVLRDGLRLVEERDAEHAAKLKALREAVNLGFKDLDEGRYVELSEREIAPYIAEIGRRAAKRVKSRK